MLIKQFYNDFLAHASYAILSEGEIALVDPGRDPRPYYEFATEHGATIKAVIETHPHADFVSSHLEISKATGAQIYESKLVQPDFNFTAFDDGDVLNIGKVTLHSINTPGHSPDSISIVLKNEEGKEYAVFTGDTLFIGDVGRPDLRETAGSLTAKREELAKAMYHSLRNKLMKLPAETIVFPAHGAGTLCGKNLSKDRQSTIGRELATNYALQEMTETRFVEVLLEDQPFVPKYFGFDVDINKSGAGNFKEGIANIAELSPADIKEGFVVVDSRNEKLFAASHLPNSINIAKATKFETWLGAIVGPEEKFYLITETAQDRTELLERIASVGYEGNVLGTIVTTSIGTLKSDHFDLHHFENHQNDYTIVDIRNTNEVKSGKIFEQAITIPLPELRERVNEIPSGKPVVVHCAGGYRSIAGVSIVKDALKSIAVYDMGAAIKDFAAKITV